MKSIRWEKRTGQYASGEALYLGRWNVGGYHWDSCRTKDDERTWRATCALPGMKDNLGSFVSEGEAKEVVEKAVKHWLSGADNNEPHRKT